MKVIEFIDYLKSKIETGSAIVSSCEISAPEIDDNFFQYRNFPAINIWDMGYRAVNRVQNTSLVGRLRTYDINILFAIRNPQTRWGDQAFKELLTFTDEIDQIINDLSGAGNISPSQDLTLKGQMLSGQRMLRHEDINEALFTRIASYTFEGMGW